MAIVIIEQQYLYTVLRPFLLSTNGVIEMEVMNSFFKSSKGQSVGGQAKGVIGVVIVAILVVFLYPVYNNQVDTEIGSNDSNYSIFSLGGLFLAFATILILANKVL